MKQYKCLIPLFAAALFMGACSDDDNDYGTEGVAIETPAITGETSNESVQIKVACEKASFLIECGSQHAR